MAGRASTARRSASALRDRHGITVAGGQGELEGRILRIGSFGAIEAGDIVRGLAALEVELLAAGALIELGAGVGAFSRAHARMRVLVAETIAAAGIDRLRQAAEVDVATDLERAELLERIAGYDALVVRSATRVDAELIARRARGCG